MRIAGMALSRRAILVGLGVLLVSAAGAKAITPATAAPRFRVVAIAEADYVTVPLEEEPDVESLTPAEKQKFIAELEEKMREAARKFEFERAAQFRDRVKALKQV